MSDAVPPWKAELYALMRRLVPSVAATQAKFSAYYLAGDMRVLIPSKDLTAEARAAVEGGTLYGLPVHVADVNEPMMAVPLTTTNWSLHERAA